LGPLRQLLATNADLARRLDLLEAKYDKQFSFVLEAIRQLMVEPEPPKPTPIGVWSAGVCRRNPGGVEL